MKSTGKPGNGSLKLDGIKDAPLKTAGSSTGSVLSPEKCIVVVIVIILQSRRKPTAWICAEGSSPVCDMASVQDTTGV